MIMKVEDARERLFAFEEDGDPVTLPLSILAKLDLNDMPYGATFQVGASKDDVIHLDWNGIVGREGSRLFGEPDLTWTRKYWYEPIGLEQYLDLVKRAVELRNRVHGDVKVTRHDDDGAYVSLTYRIDTTETNLRSAYNHFQRVAGEIEEAARQATDEIGERLAKIAGRLSGWGAEDVDALVDAVEKAITADEKGRSLEELCSRLFASVAGFTVTGRIKTKTEEIDITVLNDSNDPRLRREGAIVLAECKNWSGRCGKEEFVLFKAKIENRVHRSTLGYLISWSGFSETVTKEMLRGSREEMLVVPVTGEDIRKGVRSGQFENVLLACWDNAIRI